MSALDRLRPLVNLPSATGPWYRLVDAPGNLIASALARKTVVPPEVVAAGSSGALLAFSGPLEVEPRAGEAAGRAGQLAGSADDVADETPLRPDWLRRLGRKRQRAREAIRLHYGRRLDLPALAFKLLPRLSLVVEAERAGLEIGPKTPFLTSEAVGGGDLFQDLLAAGFLLPRPAVIHFADAILTVERRLHVPAPDGPAAPDLVERLGRAFPGPAPSQPVFLHDSGRHRLAGIEAAAAAGLVPLDAKVVPLARLLPALRAAPAIVGVGALAAAAAALRITPAERVVEIVPIEERAVPARPPALVRDGRLVRVRVDGLKAALSG